MLRTPGAITREDFDTIIDTDVRGYPDRDNAGNNQNDLHCTRIIMIINNM